MEKAHILSGNSHHPAQLQSLDKPVLALLLFFVFFFLALLVLPALIIFLAHVDFFPSPIICTLSPLPFHPSFIPLVFPSPSILAPLIPTGVVIPSPQRRLNDFILLRLSLLLLMMCLVPSHFDVD